MNFWTTTAWLTTLGETHGVEMVMKQAIFLSMYLFIMEYSLTFWKQEDEADLQRLLQELIEQNEELEVKGVLYLLDWVHSSFISVRCLFECGTFIVKLSMGNGWYNNMGNEMYPRNLVITWPNSHPPARTCAPEGNQCQMSFSSKCGEHSLSLIFLLLCPYQSC